MHDRSRVVLIVLAVVLLFVVLLPVLFMSGVMSAMMDGSGGWWTFGLLLSIGAVGGLALTLGLRRL